MKLPTYYCPHCKRFKRDIWIDRINGEFATFCRGCRTDLIRTDSILFEIVEERVLRNEHNRSI